MSKGFFRRHADRKIYHWFLRVCVCVCVGPQESVRCEGFLLLGRCFTCEPGEGREKERVIKSTEYQCDVYKRFHHENECSLMHNLWRKLENDQAETKKTSVSGLATADGNGSSYPRSRSIIFLLIVFKMRNFASNL